MENEKRKFNFNLFMVKAERISAWILALVMIIYGLSGYGITKGIINPDIANSLHLNWLGGIALVTFCLHVGWAAHITLRRKGWWNNLSKTILLLIFLGLISFFSYLHFFYQAPNISTNNTSIQNSTIFTAETLKKYNGLNGQAAYVAIDGVVYDMSSVFKNGLHHGYKAGQDLSTPFHNEHPDNLLKRYSVVGIYQ